MLIYAAANQGRSNTSFILLRCESASAIAWSWFSNVLAAMHLRPSHRIIRVCFAQI